MDNKKNKSFKIIHSIEESSEDTPEGEYVVEKIVGKRKRGKNYEYNIKWKDYEEPTWEPLKNLTNASEMIQEYENRLRTTNNILNHRSFNIKEIKDLNEETFIVSCEKGSFESDIPSKITDARITRNKEIYCLVEWKARTNGAICEPTYYSVKEIKEKNITLLADYYESLVQLPNFPNILI